MKRYDSLNSLNTVLKLGFIYGCLSSTTTTTIILQKKWRPTWNEIKLTKVLNFELLLWFLSPLVSRMCVLFSQSLLIFHPGSICADKNQLMCNIDIHCPIGSPQTLSLLMQVTITTTGQQAFMSLQCQASTKVCFVDISEIITLSTLTTLIFTFFSPVVNIFFSFTKSIFFLSECYTFFFVSFKRFHTHKKMLRFSAIGSSKFLNL